MSLLTEGMRRLVEQERLGFVATVCPDGTPNLSPKGTTLIWEDQVVFADIRSPDTVRNLIENPAVEINVVDPLVRKGYRFKGTARVLLSGPTFAALVARYRERGVTGTIQHLVLVRVERVREVVSPVYDLGLDEAEVRRRWERHHGRGAGGDAAPEPPGA